MSLPTKDSGKLRFCFWMVVFAIGALLACGQEGGNQAGSNNETGSYRTRLVFPSDIPGIDSYGRTTDCSAAGIETITCSFFSADNAQIMSVIWQCSQGEDTVENIPSGRGINVVVTARNSKRTTLFRGEDRDVTIEAAKVTNSGEIKMIPVVPIDNDGDGYSFPDDCDDDDPDIHPDAEEIPDNQVDEDCDGRDGETFIWYRDSDSDGYGYIADTINGESQPHGYVSNSRDCDDANANIHPEAIEICGNDIDEDCNGGDEVCPINPIDLDNDGDGYTENQGDCNDTNSNIHPGASEICGNGIDEDCNNSNDICPPDPVDPRDVDDDGDRYTENQGDCNDANSNIHPGVSEICNDGIDNDCDADIDCSDSGCTPGTPISVAASDGIYQDRILISWNAALNAQGYDVYRDTSSNIDRASRIASTGSTQLTVEDNDATPGQVYYYWIRSRILCNGEYVLSDFSQYNTGYCGTNLTPRPPTRVSASDGDYADRIVISWDDVPEAEGYTYYCSTTNNNADSLRRGESQSSQYPFEDSSVTPGQAYYYWVRSRVYLHGEGIAIISDFSPYDTGYCGQP